MAKHPLFLSLFYTAISSLPRKQYEQYHEPDGSRSEEERQDTRRCLPHHTSCIKDFPHQSFADSVMEDSCELTAIVLHLIGSGARSYRYLKNGMMYKHPSVSYLE
ncbi:unnamed protein product [Callosobruchus maculatus]|uniref:Uncharacterized protein n=1 Tax=Callosobruchus maculatus TaxID=64391 RepID=A0A653C379_CALMS|nr:unnamed protein product [Callosobruchus maculatus]